ncbi:MAG: tetratricopeptide repeat protein [Deltaproteobacteria bacterium]
MKLLLALIISLLVSGCALVERHIALTKDPLTAEEHNNLGVAYEREGKIELALGEYQKAAADGDLIIPRVNMGNAYFKLGRYAEAEKSYAEALKRDKKNIEAANNLASVYIALGGRYDKGMDILLQALDGDTEIPAYALDTLGALYLRLGDSKKALGYFRRACAKAEGNPELIRQIEGHTAEIGRDCRNLSDP